MAVLVLVVALNWLLHRETPQPAKPGSPLASTRAELLPLPTAAEAANAPAASPEEVNSETTEADEKIREGEEWDATRREPAKPGVNPPQAKPASAPKAPPAPKPRPRRSPPAKVAPAEAAGSGAWQIRR